MSPPEVWGPAVWILFHTLAEKVNSQAYFHIRNSMFAMIVQICKALPCPDCSRDASQFLAKIRIQEYNTKPEFKTLIYLFHNWVNIKKRKPLFTYANMNKYQRANLRLVINNFISKYNTKGNMKLLAESFQRNFIVQGFLTWIRGNAQAFAPEQPQPPLQVQLVEEQLQPVEEPVQKVEEPVQPVEEPVQQVEEQQVEVEDQQVEVKDQQVEVEDQQVEVEEQQVEVEEQQVEVEEQQFQPVEEQQFQPVEEQQVKVEEPIQIEEPVQQIEELGFLSTNEIKHEERDSTSSKKSKKGKKSKK